MAYPESEVQQMRFARKFGIAWTQLFEPIGMACSSVMCVPVMADLDAQYDLPNHIAASWPDCLQTLCGCYRVHLVASLPMHSFQV